MSEQNIEQKVAWIEPEVLTLDLNDTAGVPNRGSDGSIHIDCTRS